MPELSILIPSRREQFLRRTIEDVLANIEADSEIIAVLDEQWAEPPIPDHPRVHLIHHSESIGQRAATNEAARMSTSKYVMKLDAHCAVSKGFDRLLIEPYENGELSGDVTSISRMYNLHGFDWQCKKCEDRTYQGPYPTSCQKCDNKTDFEQVVVWKPRLNRMTDFARFDHDLHFQYWGAYKQRPEAQGDLADVMTSVGACWFMPRARFWELGGMDERHGSWGQYGVEIAAKSWLSGGRQVVNKRAWFAHMFRTRADFSFPYPMSGDAQERSRQHSRWLWNLADPEAMPNWDKSVRPLSWILRHFAPCPDWPEFLPAAQDAPQSPNKAPTDVLPPNPAPPIIPSAQNAPTRLGAVPRASQGLPGPKISLIYYTDGRLDQRIAEVCRLQLQRAAPDAEIVYVSLGQAKGFSPTVIVEGERSPISMFRQILAGLEACTADVVFLVEHDCLYPSNAHFDFRPPKDDVFYYEDSPWKVDTETGRTLWYHCQQTLSLVASRGLLLEHYRKRVERVAREGWKMSIGFEPGTHSFPRGIDNYRAENFTMPVPIIDIRHGRNLTKSRFRREEFRNKRYTEGWTEGRSIPSWGITFGRFWEFLDDVAEGRIG